MNFSQKVVYNILGLMQEEKFSEARDAVISWFGKSDMPINDLFEKWYGQYCSEYTKQSQLDLSFFEKHVGWALEDNKIQGTPTIFIGDRQVPNKLSYEDIVYYLMRV